MKISTIVPTYCRPEDLKRCLTALQNQTRLPDEMIVVIRDIDSATWEFCKKNSSNYLSLKVFKIEVPGVVAAMNLGLSHSTGDVVAFTDDDATPHPNWLEKIERYFLQDELIGGVGGKDYQYHDDKLLVQTKQVVGKLQWFGRVIGNHHIGLEKAREVDLLKGVNMSFRRTAIAEMRFDERMKGTGAQAHFELAFCLALKRANWKLIYDPEIAVDHYPAQRFDEDRRQQFNSIAFANSAHNETLALLEHFSPIQRLVFMFWANLVGTRADFGLIQLLRFLPQQKSLAVQKYFASLQGRHQAWLTWQKSLQQANQKNHKPI
jgi:cellulose synthase/poly-beta-1,6-N-acetylglucosamine synthase-like glycosyltransferase